MRPLEQELDLLSQAILGEQLRQERDPEVLREYLLAGHDPITITLWWDEEKTRRQSLVLHQCDDTQVRFFDPTPEDEEERPYESKPGGWQAIAVEAFDGWFHEREALGLIPR